MDLTLLGLTKENPFAMCASKISMMKNWISTHAIANIKYDNYSMPLIDLLPIDMPLVLLHPGGAEGQKVSQLLQALRGGESQ